MQMAASVSEIRSVTNNSTASCAQLIQN